MTRPRWMPGPDYPIVFEATAGRVRVRVGDTVIADSADALTMLESRHAPVHYIPLADVDPAVLRESATTTYCPYKGDASYYSLLVDGQEIADAVWTYREPYDAVDRIAGRVAFYPDKVDISIQ